MTVCFSCYCYGWCSHVSLCACSLSTAPANETDDDPVGQLSELFTPDTQPAPKAPEQKKAPPPDLDGTASSADPENDPYVIKRRPQPPDPTQVNPDAVSPSQLYDDTDDDKKDDGPTPPGM